METAKLASVTFYGHEKNETTASPPSSGSIAASADLELSMILISLYVLTNNGA